MKAMTPMLASKVTELSALKFPLLLSPKLDGVRCLIIDGRAMSRKLKPIPNAHVQKLFGRKELNGLDGELIVGPANAPDVYNATLSGVMTKLGEPRVVFFVFDDFTAPGGFAERLLVARKRVTQLKGQPIACLDHYKIRDVDHLYEAEKDYVAEGYEGVMLRDFEGPYKAGRSTEREGWLLKLKRFEDSEAEVLGWQSLRANTNEAKTDALGHTKRSSHKAGKVEQPLLGALHVKDIVTGAEFDIGTGFTHEQRALLWAQREYIGSGRYQYCVYRFQPAGTGERPRFPVFKGWRDRRDM